MVLFLALYRIAALISWSILMALLSMPFNVRPGWKGTKQVTHVTSLWAKGVAGIINLRVKVSGDIPSAPGGLVVSNHLSYLDIITHGSILPFRYTPKTDIAKWPVLGWYVGLSRPIWINRRARQSSKRSLRDFAKTMRRGMYLIVYPEGTSTDGKDGILPFKSTSFEAVITGDARIIPVIIRYKEVPGRPTVCWYGEMELLPHIWQVLKFPLIEAELHFLPSISHSGRSRKELASYTHRVMSREYERWA